MSILTYFLKETLLVVRKKEFNLGLSQKPN